MKHNLKITIIILLMFLVAQLIGLFVINHYSANELPYGMGLSLSEEQISGLELLPSIILSFVVAISLFFLLTKIKAKFFLKLWFFIVVILALGISLTTILPKTANASLIAFLIAIPFAILKTYKRDIIVHNLTELLIYPGIAAIFVPIFGIISIIALLILISIYDMWAVWKSKIMQKMAKYQMDHLKIFSGFFIPYASKKEKVKIKKIRQQIKQKKLTKEQASKKNLKINFAILGGGDVAFPMIAAGVVYLSWGLLPALFAILGSLTGLGLLLFNSKKKKFYPAMPFITAGLFLGMLIGWLAFVL